jgi:hypothetical protein
MTGLWLPTEFDFSDVSHIVGYNYRQSKCWHELLG